MRRTPLEALRELRRTARQRAEARLGAELSGLRAAEEQQARCVARQASHVRGRLAVAGSRLSALQPASGNVHPGLSSPVCRARLHETREQLLRAEEVLLEFGRQRAAGQLAASIARVAEGQALLIQAECRLEVVERFLARRAEAERTRQRRREERDADDRAPIRGW
jgi:hypothetical protein